MSTDSIAVSSFLASFAAANAVGITPPPTTPVDNAPTIHGLANPGGLAAGFAAHGIPPDTEENNAAGIATDPLSVDEVAELERKLKVKHDELTAIFALYHRILDKPAEMRVAAEDTLLPYAIRSYIRLLERELAWKIGSALHEELEDPVYALICISCVRRGWRTPEEKAKRFRGKLSLLPCISLVMDTGRKAAAEFGGFSENMARFLRAQRQAEQARQQEGFDYQNLYGEVMSPVGSRRGELGEVGYDGDDDESSVRGNGAEETVVGE